jgi:HPt (histidine-containing phosphotransfer) domain-containing protein
MTDQPEASVIPDVPAEVFADHVVLRPPNRLKERATRAAGLRESADRATIARAENALERLSQEFDGWIDAEIDRLEHVRRIAEFRRDEQSFADLNRVLHDLRGSAATFGFPLAGEIADGLCALIEQLGERPPQALVNRHVEAIRAIVHENVRSRDHALGMDLVRQLGQLRAELAPRIDAE